MCTSKQKFLTFFDFEDFGKRKGFIRLALQDPDKKFWHPRIFLKNRYFIFWVLIGIFHENKYLAMNQVFYYILTYIFHISKLRMFIEDDTSTGHETERIYRRSCQSVFIWTLHLWNFEVKIRGPDQGLGPIPASKMRFWDWSQNPKNFGTNPSD